MKDPPSLFTRPATYSGNSDPSGGLKQLSSPIRSSAHRCHFVTEGELRLRTEDTLQSHISLPPTSTNKVGSPIKSSKRISWKSGDFNEVGYAAQSHSPLLSLNIPGKVLRQPVDLPVKGQKRPSPTDNQENQKQAGPDERPPLKKIRLHERAHHKLDLSTFPKGPSFVQELTASSPLFFSHRQRHRPLFPPRFSSSEAAATMLSNASREDHGGIKTVKLARGIPNMGSSPLQMRSGISSGRGSTEHHMMSNGSMSDEGDIVSGLQALGQVGITELLEQDERPTFIVDIGNKVNFQPGQLQILYANPSLRSQRGLLSLVSGKAIHDSPGLSDSFPEFKAWAMSFVQRNESLDVSLPSFYFHGIMWTSSTLRKRLRLVRGNVPSGLKSVNSNPPSASTIGSISSFGFLSKTPSTNSTDGIDALMKEPSDYFGNAQPSTSESDLGLTPTRDTEPISENRDQTVKIMDSETPTSNSAQNHDPITASGTHGSLSSPLGLRLNEAVLRAVTASDIDHFDSPKHVEQGFFDWTRLSVTPSMPRHVQFARSIDWASTDLGPIKEWPSALRGMCNLIMASPHPAAMYWGPNFVAIYNEAYILLAGQKHPKLMGMRYSDAWSEIWHLLEETFSNALSTGQATMKDDDRLFIQRSGFLEETYFSWSIIPLVGDDGSVVGLYNPCFEKTRRKIAERRMLTLREVGEKTATAREVKGFWGQVLKGLEYNEFDTPFALLYSVSDELESDGSSMHSNSNMGIKQCVLEGTLGVPEGHKAAPMQIDLRAGTEGFGKVFREASNTDRPVLLEVESGTLDAKLLNGMEWRGFGDPCKAAVVCPIHPTTGETVLGFLIMGINPRRPYDDDYSLFVQLLSRQLATSMASVVLFEEEIKRGQQAAKLAALDRIELSEQLAARTQEAVESETKFTRMAEFAPVGMFIADSSGRMTYCNDAFYEITRHPKEENSTDYWMDSVKDEDKEMVSRLWNSLIQDKILLNAEFRFKTPWAERGDTKGETWVLASAYPERNMDGSLKSVFGSITNISQQKWAEDFQKRRREEAVELKRQQENFIDITSHEMRNPLSAILQCADEISTSLSEFKAEDADRLPTASLLDSNIDAAQTIALCAAHQKRIVDDILTLSKLDSALLLVTPVDVQPICVVKRALKMFEGEVQTADIKMQFKVDDSFTNLGIDWVRLDPSRLLQVLINLTTNAIKFTTSEAKRTIIITLSALLDRPSAKDKNCVNYFTTRSKRKDLTDGTDWGNGDEVLIHFAVQDTGRGLSDSEKKLLFLRFSQASPRTHVQYGGSGLGLFISRELVELQGGEIGVASESGKGSTFAFYVKARKSAAPKEEVEQVPAPNAKSRKPSSGKLLKSLPTTKLIQDIGTLKPTAPAISDDDLKVLIVEDNLVNQRVLSKQLRNLKCTVHVANHGGECIDLLRESTYWNGHEQHNLEISVVLMDLEMPVMDGLTCARKIRELERSGEIIRHVPIIAVTANARMQQIDNAIAAGMVCAFLPSFIYILSLRY